MRIQFSLEVRGPNPSRTLWVAPKLILSHWSRRVRCPPRSDPDCPFAANISMHRTQKDACSDLRHLPAGLFSATVAWDEVSDLFHPRNIRITCSGLRRTGSVSRCVTWTSSADVALETQAPSGADRPTLLLPREHKRTTHPM